FMHQYSSYARGMGCFGANTQENPILLKGLLRQKKKFQDQFNPATGLHTQYNDCIAEYSFHQILQAIHEGTQPIVSQQFTSTRRDLWTKQFLSGYASCFKGDSSVDRGRIKKTIEKLTPINRSDIKQNSVTRRSRRKRR
ncbi:MAG: hypothetical protein MI784_15740, partial [Cytophagales bacterium]|nr:hypothetical protein [Cytophagales bacterium]